MHDTYNHHTEHCECYSPEHKDSIREERAADNENHMTAHESDEKSHCADYRCQPILCLFLTSYAEANSNS